MLVKYYVLPDPLIHGYWIYSFQAVEDEDNDGNVSDSSVDSGSSSGPNFNYILNMPLWCLTKEKVDELLKQRDMKVRRTNLG